MNKSIPFVFWNNLNFLMLNLGAHSRTESVSDVGEDEKVQLRIVELCYASAAAVSRVSTQK